MNFEKVTFAYCACMILEVDILLGVLYVKKAWRIDVDDGNILTFVQNFYSLFFGMHILAMMQYSHGVEFAITWIICVPFDEETHIDFVEASKFYQHVT